MNVLILIPNTYAHSYVSIGRYLNFFKLFEERDGYKIQISESANPQLQVADVVILFKGPLKHLPFQMASISELPKSKKLIFFAVDIHGNHINPDIDLVFKNNLSKVMERADKIICPYNDFFMRHWWKYKDKYEFFPQFITPLKDFNNLKVNDSVFVKCILSGALDWNFYPLRTWISKQPSPQLDILAHPGYGKNRSDIKVGNDYVQELYRYFCGVATPGTMDYLLAKYFEIPAIGLLLLAQHTPDMDKVGFIENKHYIKINRENFFPVLNGVLNNPKQYRKIREEGRKFVLAHHTDEHRYRQLKKIIKEVWST